MLSLAEAKKLTYGTVLLVEAAGKGERWKVNGMPKTWKRSPERVRVPIKHGLYAYGYLTEDNLFLFTLLQED